LQQVAAIADAGPQFAIIHAAHILVVAQIAAGPAVHIPCLIRLWLHLGRLHNLSAAAALVTGLLNVSTYPPGEIVVQTITLQQLATISNASLQLVVIQVTHLGVVAHIASCLTIHVATLLLWLNLLLRSGLNLRGLDHSSTARGFSARGLYLFAHFPFEIVTQTILLQQVAAVSDADLQLIVIHPAYIVVVTQVPPCQSVDVSGLILLLLYWLRPGLRLRLRLCLLLNRLRLSRLGCPILAALKFTLHPAKLPLLPFPAAIVEFALQNLLALQQLLNRHLLDLIRTLRNAADRGQRQTGGNHQRAQHGRLKYKFH
jgi:hypothetical protein